MMPMDSEQRPAGFAGGTTLPLKDRNCRPLGLLLLAHAFKNEFSAFFAANREFSRNMSEGSAMILRRSKGLFLGNSSERNDAPNFTPRNFWAGACAQRGCQRAHQSNQRRATHEATPTKTKQLCARSTSTSFAS
jgi:hypothetical protein